MRNENQISALTTLLGMTMGALGGAWWPLDIAPDFMQIVGHLTPVAWAMDAFRQLFFFGGGLPDVLLPVGVLLAAALLLFGIGIRAFKFN
jgi:ABC-2 type transport system permease protein